MARISAMLFSVSAAAIIAAAPAQAQDVQQEQPATSQPDATEPEQAQAPSDQVAENAEIVVQAQRRNENVQDVPIAVTAITPERVENLNLRDLSNLQLVTPGLQFNSGINYAQTFIRGIGFPNTTPGVEPSVATYIDGAYVERGFGTVFDILDPAVLQVLRGPQGTLWGRNATGGAILINTADPTKNLEGRAVGEIGTRDHYLVEGMFNAPLGDVFAVRFAGRYREDGGYIDNLVGGKDFGWRHNWAVRGKLLFEPSDAFRAVAQVQLDRSKRSGGANAEYLPTVYCAFCGGSTFELPVEDDYTTVVNIINDGVGGKDESEFYNLRMSYDAGPITLSSVTALRDIDSYETGDFDFTEIEAFNIAQFSGAKTFTQDLTASSNFDGIINGTAGISYLHDKSYIFLDIFSTPNFPDDHTLVNRVKTESFSLFAEATAEVTPGLKITAGGRYSEDKRRVRTPGPAGDEERKVKFDNFTPRFVISYDTGPINVYASYNKGYKAGGFSTPSGNPVGIYQPENIHSYEAGIKFVSSDRRLRANLAVFHYDHKDLQVLAVTQSDPDDISETQNANSKATGFELEADYRAADFLQLFSGVSHLSSKYTDFEEAAVQVPVFDAGGNPVGLAPGFEDLSGFRLPHAPKWTAFLGATVSAPLGSWKGELTGLVRYSSSFDFYPGGGGPLRGDEQPAYTTAQLSGRVTPQNERYEIGFFIDNLTDKKYYDFRFTTAPFGGLQYVARPRTFGLRAAVNFGS